MGSASERMIDIQHEKYNRQLAKKLGISYCEFLELDFEINTEESEDGLIYNYIMEVNENTQKKIREKINGLEDGKRVWFANWELDNEDYIDN